MCGTNRPDPISARLSQPKLGPASPPVVLVATRPCSAGQTTTCVEPRHNTTVSVWRCRKSRSAPKRVADPTAGPLYHGPHKIGMSRNSGTVLLSGPMKRGMKAGLACVTVMSLGLFVTAGCKKHTTDAIAVIPKGTAHEFWKSVHAGAEKASQELGVNVIWKGAVREDDREDQTQVVESFINMHVK